MGRFAWRFVRWLLDARPELTDVARRTFAAIERNSEVEVPVVSGADDEHERFGVLGARTLADIHRAAHRAVVRPCARQLLRGLVTQPWLDERARCEA